MVSVAQLENLIANPNEALATEYKSWLDLDDADHKATVAKAVIALANHGGGRLVLGFREEDDGSFTSIPPEDGFVPYTQDRINNVVRAYANPAIHCDCVSIAHPETGVEHFVVSVPGGHMAPIIARRGSPGNVLHVGRCYIRKPGPESAEPASPEEWRTLFDTCIHNRREDMLDAIRGIVLGIETGTGATADLLSEFRERARARLAERLDRSGVEEDHPSRFPHGSLEVALHIEGPDDVSLNQLRNRIEAAGRIRHTGWSKFFLPTRPELAAGIVNGGIECWLGRPDIDRVFADAAHSDFWRAEPGIFLYHQTGLQEDVSERIDPGVGFDITLPVWRVGEFVLFAGRFGEQLEGDPSVQMTVRYTGLRGRHLVALEGRRFAPSERITQEDTFEYSMSFNASQAYDNLAEILQPMGDRLFELFDFAQLTPQLVVEESERLKESRV